MHQRTDCFFVCYVSAHIPTNYDIVFTILIILVNWMSDAGIGQVKTFMLLGWCFLKALRGRTQVICNSCLTTILQNPFFCFFHRCTV
jgi:hypothetical protein